VAEFVFGTDSAKSCLVFKLVQVLQFALEAQFLPDAAAAGVFDRFRFVRVTAAAV
jgi:hypothetical protein